MPDPTIVATPSATNANSYITATDAGTYFSTRLNTTAWDNASTGDRAKALLMACRAIEKYRFFARGGVAVVGQALKFPRLYDTDASGTIIIPQRVKDAQCEEALALLARGTEQDKRRALQAAGVTSFSVDGLSETYGSNGAAAATEPLISAEARALLVGYVTPFGIIGTSDLPLGEYSPGSKP